jgi:hypothetical protein
MLAVRASFSDLNLPVHTKAGGASGLENVQGSLWRLSPKLDQPQK